MNKRIFSIADHRHMAHAMRLAARGLYTTAPNPRVGCVLVRDGRVVGEGFHQYAGQAHAEVNALDAAGDQARGATAYVTLEPCKHTGRTGPCSEALLRAGVGRVVAAMADPNPSVCGHGLERLSDAGVSVQCGLMQQQALELNAGFIARMRRGRPFVRVKMAMSLDGRTAMANGESQWITGPDARRDVQHWRAQSGAVVTGIGTVLADDPSLNVRVDSFDAARRRQLGHEVRQPLRVIVDSNLRTPGNAQTLRLDGDVIVAGLERASATDSLLQSKAHVLRLPDEAGKTNLGALLDELAQREVNDVLVEAGGELTGAFVREGLADELLIFMAPTLLGSQARGLLHLPGLTKLAQQVRLQFINQCTVGKDIRIRARPITAERTQQT
ncbi:MAG: diaminohydroxyphosphoribosylaminopyrimidine deaminase [Gammaproteobacteria bacterium]|jgi:diaminohydroxyphosphoribosylaminopyrimidine deaminase/5-amino-6-(5-phosphoribosylamino)uracil reductase